jgi:hypothetical protein
MSGSGGNIVLVSRAYVYLLGLYLGDGNLSFTGRTYQLRLTLDSRYPEIIDSAAAAVREVVPHGRVHVRARGGAQIVEVGWKGWPELLPQHGRGPKHTRPIVLGAWQDALVDTHPREFLRGLVHSDGCRVLNRFTVELTSGRRSYAYPRYFFTNRSSHIRGLFCEYCEQLGVRWTRSNDRTISVAERRSVALLDDFIGEKR